MAHIERLRVYPVKGLDGIDRETARVLPGGTLGHDREFALFDTDGDVLNGKRTDRVHDLETDFDADRTTLTVQAPERERREFALDSDAGRKRAEAWFSTFFGVELTLKRETSLGFVDRPEMGPSVVSTATLEAVASWFDELRVDGVRRRLRANIEVSGVDAFWEDQFVGEAAPGFEANGVHFEGVTPCGRCVVPERDPDTGEATPNFRERFVEMRAETFPEWADREAFEHYYTLMVIASVPEEDRGGEIAVGDSVAVSE